jgi:hypothetical protein
MVATTMRSNGPRRDRGVSRRAARRPGEVLHRRTSTAR